MKEGKYVARPIAYHQQLLQAVVKERWTKTMEQLLARRLMDPFPYSDFQRMIAAVHPRGEKLDGADWNTYWMEIAGAARRLITNMLPDKELIHWCSISYFLRHPEWGTQNDAMLKKEYPSFYLAFREYELARFYVLFFYYKWTAGQKNLA